MQLAQLAKSYKTMSITTASPGRLILMLFDGALRFMEEAENAFQERDFIKRYEKINNNLVRAQDILRELRCSLNMDVGSEYAEHMMPLYGFMIAQLQQANVKKDPEPIRLVSKLLSQIRDAWAQMLEQTKSQVA